MSETKTSVGSCHCGAVRWEVELDLSKGMTRCNCSICTKLHNGNAIVKPDAFRLLSGEDALSEYRWGSKAAPYLFCKHCGVHSFGRGHLGMLGGDFVAVNLQCLDGVEIAELPVAYWDGRHDDWKAGTRPTPWPILTTSPTS
ncbi:MAG: GFA family protein [Myxococcota bacterium]|nr:GFA family protein [Myxococcota bacterium]